MKRIIIKTLKVVAVVAGVVAFFMPFHTATQLLIFAAALVVFITCAAISGNLDDENVGYWPEQPKDSTPRKADSPPNSR